MLLDITEKRIEPDITLLELSGKLALGRESQRIESMVEEMTKKGATRVIFDMSKVDYIDSAGIGLVALCSGKLKEAGGKLVVVAPEGRVKHLMSMTQVDAIVTVCATAEAAASAFGETHPPAAA
jgi:anti-anti-sigma factor